jgi:pimeloyl-ACP methyl ester carboxylesterase
MISDSPFQTNLHFQQIGSDRIYYETAGEGEPLILLHGLSGSSRWWKKNIAILANKYQVYLIDLIGFGRSRGQRFTLLESAGVILRWMDMIGLDSASIVGHSMGGYIAAELAAIAPNRIKRLILVDAVAVAMHRSFLQAVAGLLEALPEMPFDFFPVLFRDAYRAGPVTLLRAVFEILHADIGAKLKGIQADTLIIWGESDRVLPLEIGQNVHKRLPSARFLVVERAGHVPMWDRPEQFNQAVLDFLGEASIHE